MKPVLVGAALALVLSLAGLTKTLGGGSTTGKTMTQKQVIQQVSAALDHHPDLELKVADCALLFSVASDDRWCYSSTLEPGALQTRLARALQPVASTPGWTTDYAVPGAFYQMNADPGRTFGVAIKAIKGSLDFEGVKALAGQASFVTVTADAERKP